MSVWIPLRDTDGVVRKYALVADDDRDLVEPHRWHLTSHGYARATIDGRKTYMHRLILGLEPGSRLRGDHINGDGLDNRRENLRAVTHAENLQNRTRAREGRKTSRYRNVSWSKQHGKWAVCAGVNGKTVFLGAFDDEDEAGAFAAGWRAENMPGSREAMGVAA